MKPIPRGTGKSERAPVFALINPRKTIGSHQRRYARAPRLTIIGWDERVYEPPKPELKPDDLMDALLIARRLMALKSALENLPKQAKRLVWVQGRRKLKAMRPGRPPGFRETPRFEVDEVLRECQWLAWEAEKVSIRV